MIPKTTLARLAKINSTELKETVSNYGALFKKSQIFTITQEKILTEYLLFSSKMHYGLTKTDAKKLAYEFGCANGMKIPESWKLKKIAGEDWWKGFARRNHTIAIRKPEATSLSRCTSFNKKNIEDFFDNLQQVYSKYKLDAYCIYNCDETALTTVQAPNRVIAQKGLKQVGQVTSGERGTLVTGLFTVNAAGNFIPPFYVFPRANFKDYMLHGAPTGSAGCAYKSGWMTADNFLLYLEHFRKFTAPSVEKPVLLLLDNHDSHISIDSITFCKENHIILLTFPPHCTEKLQPLDVGVYGPLKSYYNGACDAWMNTNPGKTITIYEIAALSSEAMNRALTPSNILSAFKKTGIYPYNRSVFEDCDYLMSYVTDRPAEVECNPVEQCISTEPGDISIVTSPTVASSQPSASTSQLISPEELRPYPKAGPRKKSRGGRKPAKTLILTNTPVKERVIAELKERKHGKKTYRRKIKFPSSSSSEEEDYPVPLIDTDDDLSSLKFSSDGDEDIEKDVRPDDFAIVRFATKKIMVHYVGKIVSVHEEGYDIKFLRRKRQSFEFIFPNVDDTASVEKNDIVKKLPAPMSSGGTERAERIYIFSRNLFKNIENLR